MTLKNLLDARPDEPRSLGESVYVKLRDSIVGNRLKPETRLYEKEVAEALRVSRTPVREALVRLAAEGFVRMLTHRESVVRGIDSREVEDIFEFMRVMDGFAFDVEALALAVKLGLSVREIGVRWRNDPDSRVKPVRDGTKMLLSMMAIRQRMVKMNADAGAIQDSESRVQD